MYIRTKIIATIGPASESVDALLELFRAGVHVCRLNFSHGNHEDKAKQLANVREAETQIGRPIGILADLSGPKIRCGVMPNEGVLLEAGEWITITREMPDMGSPARIGVTLDELIDEIRPDDRILLDDGKLRLEVVEKEADAVVCRVVVGGMLTSHKGVNLPDTPLSLSSMTEKDHADARWIATQDFDYVALSFVQRASDIEELRGVLETHGSDAQIVAKIEKPQALDRIDEIIEATDVVMVARGDLGVEMDFPEVPVAQKRIARLCRAAGVPCIIATQMLESMMSAPIPTRAEVSDVANAVLDHADAVMLSGETAVGDYPTAAVDAMHRTVASIQAYDDENYTATPVAYASSPTTAAIARSIHTIMDSVDIVAICVYTASGASARLISKNRPACPIIALAPTQRVVQQLTLCYGVSAFVVPLMHVEHTGDVLNRISDKLVEHGFATDGQQVVLVSGRPLGESGATNNIVIHTIGKEGAS